MRVFFVDRTSSFVSRVLFLSADFALASHAASVCGRFQEDPFSLILAVGAEALSMTPSGDALFAS